MALISKAMAQKIAEEAEKRGGGTRNIIPFGVHDLKITEVHAKHTKEDAVPMIQLVYADKEGKHDPISEYFVIKEDGKGPEYLAKRLKAFDAHNLGEVETIEDLAKYVSKNMLNKTIRAAITHEKRLYRKDENSLYINVDVRIAYTGSVDEEMTIDVSKAVKELPPNDQAEYDAFLARKNGGVSQTTTQRVAASIDEDDDLAAPAPAKKAPAAGPLDLTNLEEKIAPAAATTTSAVLGSLDDDI